MPPRSTTDRDEHSMRRECWDSSSCDLKDNQQASARDSLLAAVATTRSVRFAPTAKVRQITKFSKEQAKDIWFGNEDFAKMKRSFAPTVQRMMNNTLTEADKMGEDHCIRGLEYRTKDGARKRMKNKFNGMASVLHEQDRQIFEENEDPERLAQLYQEVNAHCMEDAIALGALDELDIKEYMSSDNEPFYDAADGSRGRSKRGANLKASGSFHERSIRRLKRVFSGGKGKLRRRTQSPAVFPTSAA